MRKVYALLIIILIMVVVLIGYVVIMQVSNQAQRIQSTPQTTLEHQKQAQIIEKKNKTNITESEELPPPPPAI
ncbi:MAG TPA: hypothetical protein ENG42_03200 [Candidatus Aenigmarchaeota archaeon]|nr:MAG: hypothetical protein DRP03_01830 [Candidatus Aenigmarchaeota archaeon]HDD46458.1 hypothetical protein [Candidatus Aenigmarchaeota archaeon]